MYKSIFLLLLLAALGCQSPPTFVAVQALVSINEAPHRINPNLQIAEYTDSPFLGFHYQDDGTVYAVIAYDGLLHQAREHLSKLGFVGQVKQLPVGAPVSPVDALVIHFSQKAVSQETLRNIEARGDVIEAYISEDNHYITVETGTPVSPDLIEQLDADPQIKKIEPGYARLFPVRNPY